MRSPRSITWRHRRPLASIAALAACVGACNALSGVDALELGDGVPDGATAQHDGETPRSDAATLTPDAAPPRPSDGGDAESGTPDGGPRFKRVFVTSATFQGNLGGLAGADDLCAGLAVQANLGGSWVAWVSSNSLGATSNARDRVNGLGPWHLVDGTLAVRRANLQGALPLQAPIRITETGALVPSNTPVWTGTRTGGLADDNDCVAWSSVQLAAAGSIGAAGATNSGWTADDKAACIEAAALYCFEE